MNYALQRMCNKQKTGVERKYIVNAIFYESVKMSQSEYMKNHNHNADGQQSKRAWANASEQRHKEQSKRASKRNLEYWAKRKSPTITLECNFCHNQFITNSPIKKFCNKSCSAKGRNMRRLGLQGAASNPGLSTP